jgi:hypothetical protein
LVVIGLAEEAWDFERAWNEFMSCSAARSPIKSATGLSFASAYPVADEMIPSIPLSPSVYANRAKSIALIWVKEEFRISYGHRVREK